MAVARPRTGRLLLDLAATAPGPAPHSLKTVTPDGWRELGALAQLHRMEPWLHARQAHNAEIPQWLRGQWQVAHRAAAIAALAWQAELAGISRAFTATGLPALALKGSYLARYCYPHAALRPLRDIDLLVPENRAIEAFELLIARGCSVDGDPRIALADSARIDMHLPALQTPNGGIVELHLRLTEQDGRLEYAVPQLDAAAVIARGMAVDAVAYPAPEDMLAHLILHAVYGHRFDCGPLLLTDVHFLVQSASLDWDMFWRRAEGGGWDHAARLVLELVRRSHGDAGLEDRRGELPGEQLLDLSEMLLCQDYRRKKPARLAATLMTGGFARAFQLATGRLGVRDGPQLTIDRSRDGGRLRWVLAQAVEFAADLRDPSVRRQARELARFKRWIDDRRE